MSAWSCFKFTSCTTYPYQMLVISAIFLLSFMTVVVMAAVLGGDDILNHWIAYILAYWLPDIFCPCLHLSMMLEKELRIRVCFLFIVGHVAA